VGRPETFKYAPHLSFDIHASVEKMIEDGFNVTMVYILSIYSGIYTQYIYQYIY
jgi:hypothetical protein